MRRSHRRLSVDCASQLTLSGDGNECVSAPSNGVQRGAQLVGIGIRRCAAYVLSSHIIDLIVQVTLALRWTGGVNISGLMMPINR